MISRRPRRMHESSGKVWMDTANGTPTAVQDVFGPRVFTPHTGTTGYPYDWHRGVDVVLAEGDPLYSPQAGCVVRRHYTHFGWEEAEQLDQWAPDADGGANSATFARVAPSTLRITGTASSAGTFPSVAKYVPVRETVQLEHTTTAASTLWEFRVKLATTGALSSGAFGFAFLDSATGQHVGMEWNGTVATALGVGSGGAMASNGTTRAVTTEPWLRIYCSGTSVSWDVSADAVTWLNVASQTLAAMTTPTLPIYTPVLYWRSTGAGSAVQVDLESACWYDDQTIDRFGNWVTIAQSDEKMLVMHMSHIAVGVGAVVEAGDLLGYVGLTGFDVRSGVINSPHAHIEYVPNNNPLYNNSESVNPLAPGIMPRANVSNNVSVVRTTANDPDGVDSWKLAVSVARADQDFDVNGITLTANLATRTLDWNTRAGLNADVDIPKQAGVYIVPGAFDENSAANTFDVYFNKSVVGTTFTSAAITDTAGTTLWSE